MGQIFMTKVNRRVMCWNTFNSIGTLLPTDHLHTMYIGLGEHTLEGTDLAGMMSWPVLKVSGETREMSWGKSSSAPLEMFTVADNNVHDFLVDRTGVQFKLCFAFCTISSARKNSTGARLLVELKGIMILGGAQGAEVTITMTSSMVVISVTRFFARAVTLKIPSW